MIRLCSRSVLGAMALWTATAVQAADVVERRGAEPPVTGEVVAVDDAGVTVRSGIGATHQIPWDRVRSIDMDNPPPDLEERLAMAQDLWRARSRLERGDASLAELSFERLFEAHAGGTHETALVIAEGLLRCRLARQDHPGAVAAALEVARLRRAGVTTLSYGSLEPVYDETTSLCTALVPVWISQRSTERLAAELARYDAQDDEVVAAMAELYRRSLPGQQQQGDRFAAQREVLRHPGVRVLRDIIEAVDTEAVTREAARGRLIRDVRTMAPWLEAWARYQIGVSYLMEDDPIRHDLGAVSLSHLPAKFSHRHAYLAAAALHRLVEFAESRGETSAAESLRMELVQRFAHHPVRSVHD